MMFFHFTFEDFVQRFQRLFLGYEKAHGTYEIRGEKSASGKVAGQAITLQGPATDADFAAHLAGTQGMGLVPLRLDNTCYFGAIDIDAYTIDHAGLQKKINQHKIPMVLFRTKSGGAHLYIFCKEAIDAQILREKMIGWAAKLGYAGSEIFPKQTYRLNNTDIGNWINIPYFQHDATERYAFNENGERLSFQGFLDFAESKMVDLAKLKGISATPDDDIDKSAFIGGPPCLKTLYANGGFPEGTRNNGMYNVAVYLKKKYKEDWEKSLSEYNTMACSPVLGDAELKTLIGSVNKKDYQYSCKQSPICEVCNKSACLKQPYGVGDHGDDAAVGVEIGNITKYAGEPVIWVIEVDGHRVQLGTDDLYNQAAFAKICMEKINRLPTAIAKYKWEKYLNDRLAAMKPEDTITVPVDASNKGQFHQIFNMFCNNRVNAKTKEEMLSNKPWQHEGKIHFTSRGLFEFLQSKRFSYKNEHAVWQMLREAGAEKGFANIKGQGLHYWIMPMPEQPEPEIENIDFKGEDF